MPTKNDETVKQWIVNHEEYTEWDDVFLTGARIREAASELELAQSEIMFALDELEVCYDTDGLDKSEVAIVDDFDTPKELITFRNELDTMDWVSRDNVPAMADRHGLGHPAALAQVIRSNKMDPAWRERMEASHRPSEEIDGTMSQPNQMSRQLKIEEGKIRGAEDRSMLALAFFVLLGIMGLIFLANLF